MTPERTAALARIGAAFTPETIRATRALYVDDALRLDIHEQVVDLSYGPHERHRLDLFRPKTSNDAPVVLLFVHGGGFVAGDKGGPGDPFYRNIGAWAAVAGFVAATINYRLAPGAQWPAGGEDVLLATRFLAESMPGARIVALGQSAGATHVADAVVRDDEGLLAGAIMVSGIYDVPGADSNPFKSAYYGDEADAFGSAAALPGLLTTSTPCLYTVSEYDPTDFQRQAALLVAANVREKGRWPDIHRLAGHNHLSSVLQIGASDDTLGPIILDFLRRESAA